jgi:hypothetical protein
LDRAAQRAPASKFAGGLLDALSAFFVALGIVAAGALLFSVWALALGTWIS